MVQISQRRDSNAEGERELTAFEFVGAVITVWNSVTAEPLFNAPLIETGELVRAAAMRRLWCFQHNSR